MAAELFLKHRRETDRLESQTDSEPVRSAITATTELFV